VLNAYRNLVSVGIPDSHLIQIDQMFCSSLILIRFTTGTIVLTICLSEAKQWVFHSQDLLGLAGQLSLM